LKVCCSLFLLAVATILAQTGALCAQSAERAPDTMAARVLACASCHGDKGQCTNDDYFPRLAGKPSGYLYNQLVAFRDGRRKYLPMNYLLEFLPNAYLKAMADYFASEQPPFPPPATPIVSGATWRVEGCWRPRAIPLAESRHVPIVTGQYRSAGSRRRRRHNLAGRHHCISHAVII
jgi:cytochrome c553